MSNDIINIFLAPVGIVLAIIVLLVALRFLFPKETGDLIRRITSIRVLGGRVEAAPSSNSVEPPPVSASRSKPPRAKQDIASGTVAPAPTSPTDDTIKAIKRRRLLELKKQQAIKGIDTEPQILIEIEELEKELSSSEKSR
jgi:hypothetical protein